MPKHQGIGYGDCTPQKMEHLQAIFEMHISITSAVIRRCPYWTRYHYIDATAGAGEYPDLQLKGSPVLFLDALLSVGNGISFRADFIEREPENCENLERWIPSLCKTRTHIHNGEYQTIVPHLLNGTNDPLGLFFVDPTELRDVHRPTITLVSHLRPRMEILLYLGATLIKRTLQHEWPRLDEYINCIAKQHWLIREPVGREQWTFLLGSNWDQFKDYKRIGFYRLDSPRGREVLTCLNYTAKELDGWEQPTLPLIGPMLNTSDIPATGPYAHRQSSGLVASVNIAESGE